MSDTDDFSTDNTDNTLGPNWTTGYSSSGAGNLSIEVRPADEQVPWNASGYPIRISQYVVMTAQGDGDIAAYSSLPNSDGESVGARYKAGAVCPNCCKPFEAGHVLQAELAPNMGGTFHHTDCDDPTLAKVVDE